MKNSIFTEIGIAALLIVFVGILTYANKTWMPSMGTLTILAIIVVAFGAFTVFVWHEDRGDEREQLIRFVASRAAFLATGLVLLLGIVTETLLYQAPNPWLGFALIVMVSAKIIAHAYGHKKY